MKLDKDTLRDLVDEKLPRGQVRAIQSGYKDADRFDKYVAILQEQVQLGRPDRAAVRRAPVHRRQARRGELRRSSHATAATSSATTARTGSSRRSSTCARPSRSCARSIPDKMHGDPEWNVLREYFCPGCRTLLEVEAVPPGYPPVHDFVPDLEGFYNDWLGRPLPAERRSDLSHDRRAARGWSATASSCSTRPDAMRRCSTGSSTISTASTRARVRSETASSTTRPHPGRLEDQRERQGARARAASSTPARGALRAQAASLPDAQLPDAAPQQAAHSDAIHFNSMPAGLHVRRLGRARGHGPGQRPARLLPGQPQAAGARRCGRSAPTAARTSTRSYEEYVARADRARGPRAGYATIRKGQALIWAANLLHGGARRRTRAHAAQPGDPLLLRGVPATSRRC